MRNARGLFTVQVGSELRECLNLWLDTVALKTESKRTVCVYGQVVSRFLEYLEAQRIDTLDAVEPCHVRAYLLDRKQSGISPSTLAKDDRHIRAFWNWCLREGLTENNPFTKVEKPKPPAKVKPALTPDEVEAILRACEGKHWLRLRDRALCLLLLDTGLRIHEAHNLTVGDAKQEVLLIRGKGGKQRVVFLSHEVRLAIRRYLNACPYALTGEAPLWWGERGALTLNGLLEVIQRIGKRAGLPKHLGAHVLRHTFATWSLRNGIDLEHLRQLMGHSDYTGLRQYLSLVEADLKQAHQQHSPLRNLRHRKPK